MRWTDYHYKGDSFIKNNKTWNKGTFVEPKTINSTVRIHKYFCHLNERSKRRKTEELRKTQS